MDIQASQAFSDELQRNLQRDPREQPQVLDNLDPLRWVEVVFPEISRTINQHLQSNLDRAALGLIDLAVMLLRERMTN